MASTPALRGPRGDGAGSWGSSCPAAAAGQGHATCPLCVSSPCVLSVCPRRANTPGSGAAASAPVHAPLPGLAPLPGQVPRRVRGTAVAPRALKPAAGAAAAAATRRRARPGRASAPAPEPLASVSSGGRPPAGGPEVPWTCLFIYWEIGWC